MEPAFFKTVKNGIKNTIYVVFAQGVGLLLGIVRTVALPLALGVTSFGYWQVYMLYVSYVGVLAFGFNDGIYLRYGKYEYAQLPRPLFRGSIRLFLLLQIVVTVIAGVLITFEPDAQKRLAMAWAAFNIPIAGLSGILIHVFQITNQFKKYSLFSVLDKSLALSVILFICFAKLDSFFIVVIIDTIAKLITLCFMAWQCRELLFGSTAGIHQSFCELTQNIRIGIQLMFANFAGMLVLGFGRFVVERFESVETYGVYSLAISTINLLLTFVSAVGMVVFPTMNRLPAKQYAKSFSFLNRILTLLVFLLLFAYFPAKGFIEYFLPAYLPALEYLPVVFLIVFSQTRMQILITPFYKLLRKEKQLMWANAAGMAWAVGIITPLYLCTHSVTAVAAGTALAMFIRLYLSENYISQMFCSPRTGTRLYEYGGIAYFLVTAYFFNYTIGGLLYALGLLALAWYNRKVIKPLFIEIKLQIIPSKKRR